VRIGAIVKKRTPRKNGHGVAVGCRTPAPTSVWVQWCNLRAAPARPSFAASRGFCCSVSFCVCVLRIRRCDPQEMRSPKPQPRRGRLGGGGEPFGPRRPTIPGGYRSVGIAWFSRVRFSRRPKASISSCVSVPQIRHLGSGEPTNRPRQLPKYQWFVRHYGPLHDRRGECGAAPDDQRVCPVQRATSGLYDRRGRVDIAPTQTRPPRPTSR
jgi:hypothetical protein